MTRSNTVLLILLILSEKLGCGRSPALVVKTIVEVFLRLLTFFREEEFVAFDITISESDCAAETVAEF